MLEGSLILLSAFLLDLLIGDPHYRFHPTRLIGSVISHFEKSLCRTHFPRLTAGSLLVLSTLVIVLCAYVMTALFLRFLNPVAELVFDIYILYSCIALRDLIRHAAPVVTALNANDLSAARLAVQNIVGRDASVLDAQSVARAAIESVAESFVDGLFAPLFWFVAGIVIAQIIGCNHAVWGTALALAYRTVNTLDSMVGYRNEKYELLGKMSALCDDCMNYVPARFALLFLLGSATICRFRVRNAWHIMLRDRLKHASPNSGHTESFVAGALGIRLGGPSVYSHGTVEKPWIGDGNREAAPEHITDCCRLVLYAGTLAAVLFSMIGLLLT